MITDKLEDIDKLRKHYLDFLHLNISLQTGIEQYLNLSESILKTKSSQELLEIAVSIRQAINFIQLDINRHQTNYNWCQRYLNYIIAGSFEQVGNQYTPSEIKKNMVIKNNDVASELNKIMSDIQLYLDSLKDIPYNLNLYTSSLEKLAYNKKDN